MSPFPTIFRARSRALQGGIRLQNPLLWDIQQFYRDEYQVGLKANEIVLEETGVAFTEDEAGFIAMHFVNAQIGGEIREVYDMTYLMQAALRIVREVYGAEPDSSTIEYYRFITHLKFFARRIVGSQKYGDEDTDLLEVVRFKYPCAFACAEKDMQLCADRKGLSRRGQRAAVSDDTYRASDEGQLRETGEKTKAFRQNKSPIL